MGGVVMLEVMRRRRIEQGLSQADLAAAVGLDKRQIRRYEAGEAQPSLGAAQAIAEALGISLDELAAGESRQIALSGAWWAAWQTWKDGQEIINPRGTRVRQRGDVLDVTAETRGPQEL